MFTFPKASSKKTWAGQGVLWGENGMLPYMGGGSLGLCYGMSAVWIKNGAPADAAKCVLAHKDEILEVQSNIHTASASVDTMLDTSAVTAGLETQPMRIYAYPVSHMILDLLGNTTTTHYLVSFYFCDKDNERQEGHAIGISFDTANSGLIFDPNYGVAVYNSRALLCDDLHKLLATYPPIGGRVTWIYVQPVDNIDAFGDFTSAT